MPLGAAIGGGLGLLGSVGSALIGSSAAQKATSASLAQQQQHFQIAQNALNPYINSGQSVLPTLQNLLTPGSSASSLAQMPGYQFALQYGDMGATNALAAKGLGASAGPLGVALSQYNQGLAGQQYFNTVNALQGFANTGANAAGNLAGGAIQSGTSMGNTAMTGILGQGNALQTGFTGATGSAQTALLYNQLFNGGGGLYGGTPGGAIGNAVGPTSYGGPLGPSPLVGVS